MAEQKVDAYGATIFSAAGGVLTRRPQDAYARMRAAAPAMTEVFRHPEIDSSQMPAGHFGNARPLISIELDPPDRRKFRKTLDPMFTPMRLELRTALRAWHRRIPHSRVKPGIELDYTVGVRSVDSFGDGARRIRVIPSTQE